MDYGGCRPRNEKGQHLHLNWTGHRWLLVLLDQLGCGLKEWSGANDGQRISAKTCRAWAKALREAEGADRIVTAVYTNQDYHGGKLHLPLVRENSNIPLSVLRPVHETSKAAVMVLALEKHFHGWDADQNFQGVRPLGRASKRLVHDLVDFFENCGGCRQW